MAVTADTTTQGNPVTVEKPLTSEDSQETVFTGATNNLLKGLVAEIDLYGDKGEQDYSLNGELVPRVSGLLDAWRDTMKGDATPDKDKAMKILFDEYWKLQSIDRSNPDERIATEKVCGFLSRDLLNYAYKRML